jgi:Ner family transcriptional regulator
MTNTIDTSRLLKDLLQLHGTSYAQIARNLGISRTAVSLVASGRSNSTRVRQAIAEASGLTVTQIWPDCSASCALDAKGT